MPVTGLIVDQQAALLAEACLEPGTAKCTYGTGAFLLAQLGRRPGAVDVRADHVGRLAAARTRRRYCVDGQVYTAASAVRWLTDLGLIPARRPDSTLSPPIQRRRAVRAGAGRAGRPVVGPGGHRVVHRHDAEHGRGHLVRALLEGIAAQVAALTDARRPPTWARR